MEGTKVERLLTGLYYVQSELLIRDILRDPKYQDPKRLEPYGFKGNSQLDEDGIIQEIFHRIGTTDKRLIEFGVGGQEMENNTVYLIKRGWKALWLDGDPKKCEFLRKAFAGPVGTKRLIIGNELVTCENVNDIFKKYGFTGEMDLLNIDIDGNDYWVWEKLNIINPRVVVAEYNAKYAPPMEWILAHNHNHKFKKNDYMGASLTSITKLAEKKGYSLVGTTLSGANAFFVRNDLLEDHFCAPYTPENHYNPARYYIAKDMGACNYNFAGMKASYGPYVDETGQVIP